MICSRCLQRHRAADTLLRAISRPLRPLSGPALSSSSRPLSRCFSSTSPCQSTDIKSPPSTAAAVLPPSSPPFSLPFFPPPASDPKSSSPSASVDNAAAGSSEKSSDALQRTTRSKIPAGNALKGLGYLKNREVPRAWADDEYPDWLWGLLDGDGKGQGDKGAEGGGDGSESGDLFSKSKKQRRIAAKLARQTAIQDPSSLTPVIPLLHQSIDLAHGEGSGEGAQAGLKAREELTKTMRTVRRKEIKEKNFLTGRR